jgi:hypothetical protein
MNLYAEQFNLDRMVTDELTNKSVQSFQLQEMILQTDQINLRGEIEDEFTNISTQSLLI